MTYIFGFRDYKTNEINEISFFHRHEQHDFDLTR